MKTKAELQNKPKQLVSTVNKSIQKKQDATKNGKKSNVRTTDYKKMEEIFLTNPDSVTHEMFLLFQSAVGYRRAIQLLNEGKRRKQLRKMDGTGKTVRNLSVNKEQEKTDTKEQKVIQKQKLSQVSQKSENEPIQKKKSGNNTSSSTSLPSNLKSGLENLSGIDLSDVSVHKNSDKPQQVGALAYTQGNNIHVAPGQEKHLPHEGWHAVQQKQGRVAPTLQMKSGTLVNDDAGLEKEADVMGSKAIQMGTQSNILQLNKLSKINLGENKGNVIQNKDDKTFRDIFKNFIEEVKDKKHTNKAKKKKSQAKKKKVTGKIETQLVTQKQLNSFFIKTGHFKAGSVDLCMINDLNRVLVKYEIITSKKISMFMATVAHESKTGLVEGGVGNTYVVDGVDYCGGGYGQLTGYSNYKAFAEQMLEDGLVELDGNGENPIITTGGGAEYIKANFPWESVGWFWNAPGNNINKRIDEGASFYKVSQVFNGGPKFKGVPNGWTERKQFYNIAKSIF